MGGEPSRPLALEPGCKASALKASSYGDLWDGFLRGGYPELVATPGRDLTLWHASYVANLSRAGRAFASPGWRPNFVPEFPARSGCEERPTAEPHRPISRLRSG